MEGFELFQELLTQVRRNAIYAIYMFKINKDANSSAPTAEA